VRIVNPHLECSASDCVELYRILRIGDRPPHGLFCVPPPTADSSVCVSVPFIIYRIVAFGVCVVCWKLRPGSHRRRADTTIPANDAMTAGLTLANSTHSPSSFSMSLSPSLRTFPPAGLPLLPPWCAGRHLFLPVNNLLGLACRSSCQPIHRPIDPSISRPISLM